MCPGFPGSGLSVVVGFVLGGRDVPSLPGPFRLDQLGLEQADDRLGQGVVVGVADGADGGADPGVGEAFGERDRRVLRPGVGVMDQARPVAVAVPAAGPQRLLEGVEDQRRSSSSVAARQPRIRRE